MSYSLKRAKSVLRMHELRINTNLLVIFQAAASQALQHRRDLLEVLVHVKCMHLRPDHRPLSARLYFHYLFEIPFGRYDFNRVLDRFQHLESGGITREVDGAEVAVLLAAIRAFHKTFARRCAVGDLNVGEIVAMIESIQPLSDADR